MDKNLRCGVAKMNERGRMIEFMHRDFRTLPAAVKWADATDCETAHVSHVGSLQNDAVATKGRDGVWRILDRFIGEWVEMKND